MPVCIIAVGAVLLFLTATHDLLQPERTILAVAGLGFVTFGLIKILTAASQLKKWLVIVNDAIKSLTNDKK